MLPRNWLVKASMGQKYARHLIPRNRYDRMTLEVFQRTGRMAMLACTLEGKVLREGMLELTVLDKMGKELLTYVSRRTR